LLAIAGLAGGEPVGLGAGFDDAHRPGDHRRRVTKNRLEAFSDGVLADSLATRTTAATAVTPAGPDRSSASEMVGD
jgi:hypothetical protein